MKTESTIGHFKVAVPAEKWVNAANAQAAAMERAVEEGVVDNPEEVLTAAAEWRAAARSARARELSEEGHHDDAYLVVVGMAD